VNCCKAVAGRTQGDWEDWRGQLLDAWRHDHRATMNALLEGGPALRESASPMNGTEMLDSILGTLLSRAEGVNTGGDINIMKTVDRIVKRESAREAHSDDLIEALKTIADAPTHITYEGIFVSTNVKDIARKALNREKQPPNEK
jgi:hypothetical protein